MFSSLHIPIPCNHYRHGFAHITATFPFDLICVMMFTPHVCNDINKYHTCLLLTILLPGPRIPIDVLVASRLK